MVQWCGEISGHSIKSREMKRKPRLKLRRFYLAPSEAVMLFLREIFAALIFVITVSFAAVVNVQYAEAQEQAFELYQEADFGITMQAPSDWTMEGDNVWLHSDVNPWHLPLIPIKELQPTALDILPEGKKTLLVDFTNEGGEDSFTLIRVAVEKTPFGTTLDNYADRVLQRLSTNNDNVQVHENSRTTISGNPAVKLVISYGDEEYSAMTTQVLTLYGNLAYIFQYDGEGQSYESDMPTAQHVFDSVSINPPVSRAQTLSLALAATGIAFTSFVVLKARNRNSRTSQILRETKKLFPSAFGIEILCVASAEIGGFLGLSYYGFNEFGIGMAYVLAYALAGFTTFASILGRSAHAHDDNEIICGCSDMAGHNHDSGFRAGIRQTFVNFAVGLKMMTRLHRKPNAKRIVKASLIVLISAESGCVIAAATVDIMLYQYSIFLSIPVALLVGTLTVALMAAFRSVKSQSLQRPSHQY